MSKHSWALLLSILTINFFGCGPGGDNFKPPIEHSKTLLDTDTTWRGNHILSTGLTITADLTLEECTTLQLPPKGRIEVERGGSLITRGSSDCPVTITSDQPNPKNGDWAVLRVNKAGKIALSHTIVEYGGWNPDSGQLSTAEGAIARLSDVTFRHSKGRGVRFQTGTNLQMFNRISFKDISESAVLIGPNEVDAIGSVDAIGDIPPIEIPGGSVDSDTTWQPVGLPYSITGSLQIQGSLEVLAGTRLQMAGPNQAFSVRNGGSLHVLGQADKPVTIESNKASPSPGSWASFDIFPTAGSDNEMRYAQIKHAGADQRFGALQIVDGATIELDNVSFSKIKECDVYDQGTVKTTMTDFESCL